MNQQEIIPSFQKEVQDNVWDIKAELLLLMALGKGLSKDDVMICSDRFFKREFSNDLFEAVVKEDSKKQVLLELHLSRTGLYDHLPEGLFFQMPQRESGKMADNDWVLQYKKNKKKEEDIRRFFSPFESGFFHQRLQLEKEESKLLEGLRTGVLNDYFVRFWGLSPAIPKMFMVPLVLLLPHAHKIAGDLKLTAQCLGYILKEKVVLVQKNAVISSGESYNVPGLGLGKLGLNMICGDEFEEDFPTIEIKIGPLKNSKVKEYLEGGTRKLLIETFNRFFIPAGVDVIISVHLTQEEEGDANEDMFQKVDRMLERVDMLLESGAEPILGYSSVLG